MTVALAVTVIGLGSALSQDRGSVRSSLLLLIDASGSMGDAIGGGNSEVKIEAAKRAAADALSRAAGGGSVEVAVLAFSGDCQNPVPRYQDFTRDVDWLTRFIERLQPGGGTPMADALLFANRYMAANGSDGASDRMIMLLADGQNDCGDIDNALATLQASGVIFRHETVGFGITPNSGAADDLRQIATRTGGAYHHAADASQLADVFMEFVDTLTVIDMLGMFGQRAQAAPGTTSSSASNQGSASRADPQPANNSGLSSMIGGIRARAPVDGPPRAGSVPNQGNASRADPQPAGDSSLSSMIGGIRESPLPHAAQDLDDVFCTYLTGDGDLVIYYSGLFRGDYIQNSATWRRNFRDYIQENFNPASRNSNCYIDRSPGTSFSKLEGDMRSQRSNGWEVIETGWMPGSSPVAEDFETRPLRDFRITVPRTDRAVNVCVRDHECEDGDEVRVSVNGSIVLRGEIVNEWACRAVPVTEGRNSIELYAINGTGRKGDCSYADANTGEIRVEGENIETQTWRHRGGAGSSANIVVTVQ